jgi:hypothetical protein
MLPRIFLRFKARPGPIKYPRAPRILGLFAHLPVRKLAKVKLICAQGIDLGARYNTASAGDQAQCHSGGLGQPSAPADDRMLAAQQSRDNRHLALNRKPLGAIPVDARRGAPTSALGERSGAPSGLRPSSFVMCNTPVEVQFMTSAGCLNYPCRTPWRAQS